MPQTFASLPNIVPKVLPLLPNKSGETVTPPNICVLWLQTKGNKANEVNIYIINY